MVVAGRRKSIAFFIALGSCLIVVILLLYLGWVVFNWHTGILLFFGFLLLVMIISGVVLNTIFLVREIRRNEQHDAFINAVTHELKTPVASIRLYLETLQRRNVDEARRHEFYRIMLEDSDRLLGTIEQVLLTGRTGTAARRLHRAPVDLGVLIEECIARTATLHSLPAESIQYKQIADATVSGDSNELRAAISNLLDNAIKYSGANVKIEIETRQVDDRFIMIRVADNGTGIPSGELKRIFKRFYRVPGPASTRVKGTGLGLFIVRSVAKRHGGRAWAESEGPGRGSTFVFQVPIVK
jgi:two-component system, OmpR family, sensor histidine kinase SenX3